MRFFIYFLAISFNVYANISRTEFISVREYKQLSTEQRQIYIQQTRKALFQFEEQSLHEIQVSDISNRHFVLILPQAWADEGKCLIGGVEQPIIGKKCSTRNNQGDCLGIDQFKCGKIFGGACIPRTPVSSISNRCFNAISTNSKLNTEEYAQYSTEAQSLINNSCSSGKMKTISGCSTLSKRLKFINDTMKTPKPENIASSKSVTIEPLTLKNPTEDEKSNLLNKEDCLEASPDRNQCIEGSLSVRKNPDYEYCNNSSKNTDDCSCSEFFLELCEKGTYEKNIQPHILTDYLKKNKSSKESIALAKATNSQFTPDNLIQEISKESTAVKLCTDQESKNGFAIFANKFNADANKCSTIQKLRLKIKSDEKNSTYCKKQDETFNKSELKTITDIKKIALTNSEKIDTIDQSCVNTTRTEEPKISAIDIYYRCSRDGFDKCTGSHMNIFPTETDDSGKMMYIDASGRESSIQITKDQNGMYLKFADGTEKKIEKITTTPPCNVANNSDLPLNWNKSPACHPLIIYKRQAEIKNHPQTVENSAVQ